MALNLCEEILTGKFSQTTSKNQILQINELFFKNLERSSISSKFQLNFKNSKSGEDRIGLFSEYFPTSSEFLNIYHPQVLDYKKNATISSTLREKSNEAFKIREFRQALHGYNLALCFAPEGSQEMGLIYGNRSAVFLELNKRSYLERCFKDIDLALRNQYSEKLKQKLEQRRSKCSRKMELLLSIPDQRMISSPNCLEIDDYKENVLFKLQSPNPLISAAEDFVQISKHPVRGRELLVTKDVPPGTPLVVDKPFVHVLKNVLQWDVQHCHHCLKEIMDGIPCPECVFAMYCSEKCQKESFEKFHRYECPCWGYLHLNHAPRYVLLTLRLICILQPLGVTKLFNKREIFDASAEGNIYESESYKTIYQLVSHENDHDDVENFSNTMQSLILVSLLEHVSTFFRELDLEITNSANFRPWLTSIILHHLQNLPCNSISLDELSVPSTKTEDFSINAESIKKAQLEQYASGVYTTISLINHSCDPNVTRLNDSINHGRMCIISLRGIKRGETLYTSYTKSIQDSLQERQKYLRDNYYFQCSCQPCAENWPLLPTLFTKIDQKPRFRCQVCSQGILRKEYCGSCKKRRTSQSKLVMEYDQNIQQFYKSYDLVLQNDPMEAIKILIPVLKYFQSNIVQPFGKTYMAQDTLKRALDLIVYFPNNYSSL